MKRLNFGTPTGQNFQQWVSHALREVELASHENIDSVVDDFTLDGEVAEQRTLVTTSNAVTVPTIAWDGLIYPTAADATAINSALTALKAENAELRSLIATLIKDIQSRGQKRSY